MTARGMFSFPFRKFLVAEHRCPRSPLCACRAGLGGICAEVPGSGGVDSGSLE